jgi:hypothetical protein
MSIHWHNNYDKNEQLIYTFNQKLFENNFETNDSNITFIKRRFDATACRSFSSYSNYIYCVDFN